jgi:hypothetical protein
VLVIPIKVSEAFLAMREIIANAIFNPTMSFRSPHEAETDGKITQNSPHCHLFISKSAKYYVILAEKWAAKVEMWWA